MSAIWVEIIGVRGSAPRETGTAMKVTAEATEGTIGGGALEYQAIETARALLALGGAETTQRVALGPGLGQCCGGAVTLRFTRSPRPVDAAPPPARPLARGVEPRGDLWLWGAGHVGRAVVRAVPAGSFRVFWADTGPDRFPPEVPDHVTAIPAADLPALARRAPAGAHHLVFTYSHDIDFALCATLLRRAPAFLGLIGSDTKRARFFKRLRAAGLDPAPITCPIGDKSLGKAPDAIARGVVTALLTPEVLA